MTREEYEATVALLTNPNLSTQTRRLIRRDLEPAFSEAGRAFAIEDAIEADRKRIVRLICEEADKTPCKDDAVVIRSVAWMVKTDFSPDVIERLQASLETPCHE